MFWVALSAFLIGVYLGFGLAIIMKNKKEEGRWKDKN
jgi:ABC-type phosphate transport system permease subunit